MNEAEPKLVNRREQNVSDTSKIAPRM